MKVLITGGNGFSATHLHKYLLDDPSQQVICTSRSDCDLTVYLAVEELIRKTNPDQIYHLAGSFTNQYEIDYQNNVVSTKNICDALTVLKLPCRVLLIGSAAEYGFASNNPTSETSPLNPITIYGLTKVIQTHLMEYYHRSYGLDLVMARTFNLMGKGASTKLFIGNLYHQIEKVKRGELSEITLKNLDDERDYIEISQAVAYYHQIMNQGISSEIYNVGSGKLIKISDLLHSILIENGLDKEIVREQGADFAKTRKIQADIEKLKKL
ncbi:MAG: hypothetical protein COT85_05515 [Chlamydiae bacterium CG10_big_fil_rev_8_21_14_0_10_42_34]|nr:MAG: hypothetical protein COT85_05515 [Chlamydiae bacterium CG10_big_fil_rev_8_21_14_0_10_42_34]